MVNVSFHANFSSLCDGVSNDLAHACGNFSDQADQMLRPIALIFMILPSIAIAQKICSYSFSMCEPQLKNHSIRMHNLEDPEPPAIPNSKHLKLKKTAICVNDCFDRNCTAFIFASLFLMAAVIANKTPAMFSDSICPAAITRFQSTCESSLKSITDQLTKGLSINTDGLNSEIERRLKAYVQNMIDKFNITLPSLPLSPFTFGKNSA